MTHLQDPQYVVFNATRFVRAMPSGATLFVLLPNFPALVRFWGTSHGYVQGNHVQRPFQLSANCLSCVAQAFQLMPKKAEGIMNAGVADSVRSHLLTHRMRQIRVPAGLQSFSVSAISRLSSTPNLWTPNPNPLSCTLWPNRRKRNAACVHSVVHNYLQENCKTVDANITP